MEKSSTRTLSNLQTASDLGSRKAAIEGNRVSGEVIREKSELCGSAKEKPSDSSGQNNIQRNFADFMKFGPIYGPVPSQYFDQFSGMTLYLSDLLIPTLYK